ncbi:hypothetical protein Tco_0252319 [Tanacetum coccineum]
MIISLCREFDALTKLPKSALLTRDLLPKVKDAHTTVSKEETHRSVPESFVVSESKLNATSFAAKSFNNTKSKIRHTIDRCYEIIGFPAGFKRNPNFRKQNFNANVDVKVGHLSLMAISGSL